MKARAKLSARQFDDIVERSKIGQRGSSSLIAARRYLVDGGHTVKSAAEGTGCHANTAGRLIKRIIEKAEARAAKKDNILATVEIPKGKLRELNAFVASLYDD
ncbi:MAG: hypothetical protein JKX92_06180 [Porticoccaceae bacterium]|nr:hypothetical protein [Porticoccaceae bacterium]